jgi:hypothetical protein
VHDGLGGGYGGDAGDAGGGYEEFLQALSCHVVPSAHSPSLFWHMSSTHAKLPSQ